MIIQLSPEWRVRTAPLNFILEEHVLKKQKPNSDEPATGHQWLVRGYYSGLRAAIIALPDYLAQSPNAANLTDYFRLWDDLAAHVARGLSK